MRSVISANCGVTLPPQTLDVMFEGGDRGGDDALVAELQDFVKSRIAPYKYPRAIEFVAELPRTQTGKLQRFKLRTGPVEAKA